MKIVHLHEAQKRLSRLIQEALEGEDIAIACGNQPLVRLVVVEPARPREASAGPRAR